MEESDISLFKRWVEAPVAKLRELPNGDGAFAAMSMAFGLYERYLDSCVHSRGEKPTPQARIEEASKDFGRKVSSSDFKGFWDMYRVGMQHHFHPKHFTKGKDNTRWGWDISEGHGYKAYPELIQREDDLFLFVIDPWMFIGHVLERWRANSHLMDELSETKLAKIEYARTDQPPIYPSSFYCHSHSTDSYNPIDLQPPSTGIYPSSSSTRQP